MHSPYNSRPQSKQPLTSGQAVQDRISQLSNKITNMHISKQDTSKKYQQIQSMCDQIEGKLQDFSLFLEEKLADVRHQTGKITKEVKKDHTAYDTMLKQQISAANERMMLIVDEELEAQKQTNLRIMKYIEHESNILREQMDRQEHQRNEQGKCIEQSLSNDIKQIQRVLSQTCSECQDKNQELESRLFSRTQQLGQKLRQISNTYCDNEAEFYKMLRDLVKKVKAELQEHQEKREETESQILNLIDKMCDKSIEQKKI